MKARIILHLDLDAFFCAVEEKRQPDLKGQAFAVGGQPNSRGVVASCSYPARASGVRSAMPMITARRLCPELIIVPHHFDLYRQESMRVMDILNDLTPFVEQISIDEAFLDVTGLHDSGENIARKLQSRIKQDLGLPCSLGIASNKLIAKIANNRGKSKHRGHHYPEAIEVVAHGQEANYLAPLSVTELWGVGDKTAERLRERGIRTIGQIATTPLPQLQAMFGKNGIDLWQRAQGIDRRKVESDHETKSISHETTFSRDEKRRDILENTIRQLGENVGWRLRQKGLRGTTIKIKLRWADFTTITRQITIEQATHEDPVIVKEALGLFARFWRKGEPIRLIGVGVSNLEEHGRQLSLWEDESTERNRRLQNTLDDLRERFGDKTLKRGTDLKDSP